MVPLCILFVIVGFFVIERYKNKKLLNRISEKRVLVFKSTNLKNRIENRCKIYVYSDIGEIQKQFKSLMIILNSLKTKNISHLSDSEFECYCSEFKSLISSLETILDNL